ncbi:MAG: PAS domain-containing sensor histidine kinase [Cytophaga sp.]|uniref:PAS domain-containing sensor histidine kinase n=1 Tax=Cytophaga sp. TaxID=29535 RepID=UPI003F81411B
MSFTDPARITAQLNLSNMLSQMPIGMAIYRGRDYIIELANEAMLRYWNLTAADVIEKPALTVFKEEDRQSLKAILDGVYTHGNRAAISEVAAELTDAGKPDTFYFSLTFEPLRNEQGDINGIMCLANDITQSVQTRKKLEEAEKQKSLALDAGCFGTWDFNLLDDTVELDARCRELFGMPPHEHIAPLDFWKYVNEKDHPKVTAAVSAALDPLQRADYTLEYRVGSADGKVRWIRNKGKGYFNGDVAYRFVGTAQDVTEEHRLRDEQQKLLRLVDNSIELMSLLGTNNINSYINKAGMELLGFDTMEQVLTTPISELHLKEDYEKVSAHVITSLQSKGRWSGQMNVRNLKTGEIIPVYNNTVRIDDPVTGEVLAFGAVMRDMRQELAAQKSLQESEKKYRQLSNELEERVDQRTVDLRNANYNLSRSNHDLEQFAYIASHDLQEPLRKIRIFSDLILENIHDVEFLKKYLSRINAASERMSALVKELLNYSRLSAPELSFETVDLSAIFANVITDCELIIKEKDAVIHLPALPVIYGVPSQLYQLFLNLLSNALKFNEATPVVSVECAEIPGSAISGGELIDPSMQYIHLIFKDNGIGFSTHLFEKVFTIFTRGNANPKFTGTGIGLAVCKKVVENHRGHIDVESEVGKGTSFHIYLPL